MPPDSNFSSSACIFEATRYAANYPRMEEEAWSRREREGILKIVIAKKGGIQPFKINYLGGGKVLIRRTSLNLPPLPPPPPPSLGRNKRSVHYKNRAQIIIPEEQLVVVNKIKPKFYFINDYKRL